MATSRSFSEKASAVRDGYHNGIAYPDAGLPYRRQALMYIRSIVDIVEFRSRQSHARVLDQRDPQTVLRPSMMHDA
jgi:hypothetical protein